MTAEEAGDMACGYDGRPPMFGLRRDLAARDGARAREASPVNVNRSTCAWLYARGCISRRQYDAADRYECDWQSSMIVPVAAAGGGARGGPMTAPADAVLDASRRYGDAVRALGSNALMVAAVIERGMTVADAGALLGMSRKAAVGAVWAALNHLADHYRIA